MSRTRLTEAERDALRVTCPQCKAPPGRWCVTVWTLNKRRLWATSVHRLRAEKAATDGRLPIQLPGA